MPATRRQRGFTLIELMIAVAIIGIIAAVAIPTYMRFQMKSKTAEGKVNLAAIRTSEQAYFSEYGFFVSAGANPATIPGPARLPFTSNPGFTALGWSPEGAVFFSYAVTTSDGETGFTADAGADLDSNGVNQYWAYVREGITGIRATAEVGCDASAVELRSVVPCQVAFGQSIF